MRDGREGQNPAHGEHQIVIETRPFCLKYTLVILLCNSSYMNVLIEGIVVSLVEQTYSIV